MGYRRFEILLDVLRLVTGNLRGFLVFFVLLLCFLVLILSLISSLFPMAIVTFVCVGHGSLDIFFLLPCVGVVELCFLSEVLFPNQFLR